MESREADHGKIFMVTGGVRSGKSTFAESLVSKAPRVVYVATAVAADEEMRARIAEHRARRPAGWETVEEPLDLSRAILTVPQEAALLVDCIGVWVANLLADGLTPAEVDGRAEGFLIEIGKRQGPCVAVTNEVGMGVVPAYPLGRLYRDILGRVNQQVAAAADVVYLLVCGIPLRIKP